jgi:small conductance mechanosensitive channel
MREDQWLPVLLQKGVVFLVRGAGVLLAFLVAWLVAGWAYRAMRRSLQKTQLDATLATFLANLLRYSILFGAFVACLGAVGFQTTSLAAILGAVSIAVGLAFQNTLSNFAAGFMLLLFRPFKVGDTIRVANQTGNVDELELFTTRLTTPDNRKISVPNSAVFNQVLENITYYPTRRVELGLTTPLEFDLDAARRALENGMEDIPEVLREPAPQAYVNDLTAGVNWQLRAWCRTEQYALVHQAMVSVAKRVLDEIRTGKLRP